MIRGHKKEKRRMKKKKTDDISTKAQERCKSDR